MKRVPRLIICLAVILSPFTSLAQDAPMFRGNLEHTGVYNSVGVPKLNGVKWKFHTDGRVISSPAVVNGVVYFGSTDSNLYAIDAASGTLKWKFETGSWVVSSPAVREGHRLFRKLRQQFLCSRCGHRQTEMEISDWRRAEIYRQASASSAACGRGDA